MCSRPFPCYNLLMTRALALAAVLLLQAPARAWEAEAGKVEARLLARRSPSEAWQADKPGWARKIRWPEDRVRWSERHGWTKYTFGVGLVRGVANPALRAALAEDRARASLLEPNTSAVVQGSQILDWYLDDRGGMHALAVIVR